MRTSRRGFLKTLGGVALFSIVPRHVLGNGYIAPSDQLTKVLLVPEGWEEAMSIMPVHVWLPFVTLIKITLNWERNW